MNHGYENSLGSVNYYQIYEKFVKTVLSKFVNLNPTKHIKNYDWCNIKGGIDIDIDEIVVDVPPVIIEVRNSYYLN